MTSILILGETAEAKTLDPVTGELIAAGRQIADDIGVALLGTDLEDPAREAIALGASVVYTVQDPALDGPDIRRQDRRPHRGVQTDRTASPPRRQDAGW